MKIQKSKAVACAAIALLMGSALPAAAQYNGQNRQGSDYNDRDNLSDYRQGYRAGYDDGRANRRFDDRENNRGRRGDNRGDRSQQWQQRYSRTYTQADDTYYQQCRNAPDPAGVLAGALLGGLLGNAAGSGRSQAGTTVAGIILGGAIGASLTSNLDCEDRSYAHKAYFDGFSAGRPNQDYNWRNPRNGRRGVVRVGAYYNDPDGFRCTTFSQVIYINNTTQEGRGRACQQPDGSWAIVS